MTMMRALQQIERLSRRRFVGYGAASLAFTPAIARAQSALPPAPDVEKIDAASDAAQHLTIDVRIAGKGPFRFVVDTGADRTVIADDVATALNLDLGKLVMVEGVVRTVPAQTVRLSKLSFGQIARENLVVPVLPRAMLDADGYLGLDAIDGYRVTFDFKNKALLIERPRSAQLLNWAAPSEALVPVAGSFGHLRSINCRVDGVSATAFIDTGAEVSVGNSRLFDALADHDPSYFKQETVTLSGITGGTIEGRKAKINRIHLNNLKFYDSVIVIADLQIFDLWGLGNKPALLIGMNFLRSFSQVSIDYGRKELRFELAKLLVAQRA